MADQKFSAAEREAIWLAHEKKCAYTRELIDVSSFHIDHVIPENLAADPRKFQEIKAKLNLDADFDLTGFANLLPCKPGANGQKGSLIMEDARIHYFLAIAAGKKAQVEQRLQQIDKRKNRGRALILLQQCLERRELSAEEVSRILEEHGERPHEIFRLIEALKFADKTEVDTVAKSDIEELRQRPLRLGQNNHIDGVTLTNDAGNEVFVTNCKEYDAAIAAKYFAYSNYDIKRAVFFEHQCGLLRALEAAQTPEISFIAEPRVGITDLQLMPFSLFPWTGDKDSYEDPSVTYQSKIDDGTLIVKRVKQNVLSIAEPEGMGQQLIEVARADFNGDGVEEILLFEYCHATHGTLGYGGIAILTRTGPESLFKRVVPTSSYEVTECLPSDLTEAEMGRCLQVIASGEAVDPEMAESELPLATKIAVARRGETIVAVGAIKRVRSPYASRIADRCKFEFSPDTPELGYVAVDKWHRSRGLSHRVLSSLTTKHQGALFATTGNENMKKSLAAAGFSKKGQEWTGQRGLLSLWIRE
jgi:hypothetical protein